MPALLKLVDREGLYNLSETGIAEGHELLLQDSQASSGEQPRSSNSNDTMYQTHSCAKFCIYSAAARFVRSFVQAPILGMSVSKAVPFCLGTSVFVHS